MTGRLLHWSSVVDESGNDGNARSLESLQEVPPYVAVIDEVDYTADNVARLISFSSTLTAGDHYGDVVERGGPLRGVLVLASSSTSNGSDSNANDAMASPEPLTPQGDGTPMSGLTVGSSYEWNKANNGDGLSMTDMYGYPTAYIPDTNTAEYLRGVATTQSNEFSSASDNSGDVNAAVYPSIVSEFNYYMGPGNTDDDGGNTHTSKSCLEWKNTDGTWSPKCLPLGGNSVWSVAGSPLSTGYAENGENNEGDENNGENNNNNNNNDKERPVILLSASIDSTSMFHDLSPGANTAASNILSLLMAAELIGSSIQDEVLDGLYGRIAFSFFQGESYGFIGSRLFLKDVIEGFQCEGGEEGVASVYKRREEATTARSCLYPLRADLSFQNLGNVRGLIAVDQVGNLGGGKTLYVQGGETSVSNGENGFAGFLAEVMVELSGNDNANGGDGGYTVQASSVAPNDGDDTYPLPPSPLTSLVQLSAAAYGGVVLTGYDDAFVANSLYHSHLDSSKDFQSIDSDAIAAAATVLARSAVAAAYQNADEDVDAATAAAYAMELLPTSVSSSSETFQNLYHCLFEDGNCDTFLKYAMVERKNDSERTGVDLGLGPALGTPPSYYVSIYDEDNAQAFVRASGKFYGTMVADGDDVKAYGDDENDAVLLRPTLLETSIFGLLNNFLGRGSFVKSDDGNEDAAAPELLSCESSNDCTMDSYCSSSSSSESLALPTCAGGSCVCGSRSHYHPAFDEAISPAKNKHPGYFEINENDQGISAMYTEPFWSNSVGVRIYRDAGNKPGIMASSLGAAFCLVCVGLVYRLKKRLVKEKVY